jgi:glycosyltransferase involved in cell wall biosynthesis
MTSVLRRKEFRNREGHGDYDFQLPARAWRQGVSAMLRVKNEERNIAACLASIYEAFDDIVVVDNGSSDATVRIVNEFARANDPTGKIRVFSYPFPIARCGEEHRGTPEDSVHSLAYYYNWCLSRCRGRYVVKWDADMLLEEGAGSALAAALRRPSLWRPVLGTLPIQTVYRAKGDRFFASRAEINEEARVFPNIAQVYYRKGKHWEILRPQIPLERQRIDRAAIYELKDTSADEFSHWTTTQFPTKRKRLEWRNYHRVRSGDVEGGDFVPIELRLYRQ